MTEGFRQKAEALTGMSWDEIGFWAEREEFEQQEHARSLGHCCWAGLVASPGSCVWHTQGAKP